MDYEKKYKEALEKARQFSEKPYLEDSKGIVEYIFPELKERDGEMIKKALIDGFKRYNNGALFNGCLVRDIVSWFEKQCEKDKEITILKDQIESLHAAIKALKEVHKIELKKQGEQILANSAKTCKDEQKPAWSEEDEIYISDVMWCIEQARKVAKDENDMGTTWCAERWVKSLKDRYAWKPSDEQMEALLYEVNAWDEDSVNGQNLKSLYQDLKKLKD